MNKFELINYNIKTTNKYRTILYGKLCFNINSFLGLFTKNIKCNYEYSIEEKKIIFIKNLVINGVPESEKYLFKNQNLTEYLKYKKELLNVLNNNIDKFNFFRSNNEFKQY